MSSATRLYIVQDWSTEYFVPYQDRSTHQILKTETIDEEFHIFETSTAASEQRLKKKGALGTFFLNNSIETFNSFTRSQTANRIRVDESLEYASMQMIEKSYSASPRCSKIWLFHDLHRNY